MKIEARGKYGGVKIHLEPEECKQLMKATEAGSKTFDIVVPLSLKMGRKIKDLIKEEPDVLEDRTPEQIAAILAKESEKAGLQLQAIKKGSDWKKVDPSKLEKALLKHAKG